MTIWTRLSDRRMLITVNMFSVAINLVALVLNALMRQWARVGMISCVLLLVTATVMLSRMAAEVAEQLLAEAKAKRAFAETMLEKLQGASGVTFGTDDGTPPSPFKRH